MSKKLYPSIRLIAIVCFVLALTFSLAWAVQSYSVSQVVKKNGTDKLTIVKDGNDWIIGVIDGTSLDAYMAEEGLSKVTVTVYMTEEVVTGSDGIQHLVLNFTFGPSGAYFSPSFILSLSGKYANPDCEVWLFNDLGGAIPATRHAYADRIEFEIPHFSYYSYDTYSY